MKMRNKLLLKNQYKKINQKHPIKNKEEEPLKI